MTRRTIIFTIFAVAISVIASAQDVVRDSLEFRFRQGKSVVDLQHSQNRNTMETLRKWHDDFQSKEYKYFFERVEVYGAASPEGGIAINNKLSAKRAEVMMQKLSDAVSVPDSIITPPLAVGRDWGRLRDFVALDSKVPSKQAVIALLDDILAEVESGKPHAGDPLKRLQNIAGGRAYNYLWHTYFSSLRSSKLYLTYIRVSRTPEKSLATDLESMHTVSSLQVSQLNPMRCSRILIESKPFYMSLKTNLLSDVAIVPNIGAEFYLGRDFTVSASWSYSWWKNDRTKWYWRTYGGDIAVRKYFGAAAKVKPLTGHHAGVYAQAFTYDFAGGKSGQLCDTWSYGAGVEYGYSLPISRRLNLDFALGVGYLGGLYKEYIPQDDCYVWQATKRRHWFGPTKAEVSLVWLIGNGNFNKGKGKRR